MSIFDVMKYKYTVDLKGAEITNGRKSILKNVDLRLTSSEFCYLIGRTGTGKSSLLKSLYAELPIHQGQASILGIDLVNISRKHIPHLRRQLGMIFQDFQLFKEWSVARNLSYVLKVTGWKDIKAMEAQILKVLRAVSMEKKAKEMVHNLSGGEQQRIAIARAILNNPQLIIADEPTGNLDLETSDSIFFLLRNIALQYGTTVLVATHDHRIIKKFPARVFKCENKSLSEVE